MMRYFIKIYWLLLPFFSFGQEYVFSTSVANDTAPRFIPPTHSVYLFFDMSIMLATKANEQKMTSTIGRFNSNIGLGYNYRYNIHGAFGVEFSLKNRQFNKSKTSSIFFTDSIQHQKAYLVLAGFEFIIYHRFYISTKYHKNAQGPILDFGIAGHWNSLSYYYTKDQPTNSLYSPKITFYKNPQYINPIDATVLIRVGKENFSLIIQYQLTPLINASYKQTPYNFYDLPALETGIRLAL